MREMTEFHEDQTASLLVWTGRRRRFSIFIEAVPTAFGAFATQAYVAPDGQARIPVFDRFIAANPAEARSRGTLRALLYLREAHPTEAVALERWI